MKKLAILLVAGVVALVGYNYFTTGEISLIPGGAKSVEAQELAALEERFEAAREQVGQAHRAAGVTGIDTTADVEAARRTVGEVARELEDLQTRLTSEADRKKAEKLARTVGEYVREIR